MVEDKKGSKVVLRLSGSSGVLRTWGGGDWEGGGGVEGGGGGGGGGLGGVLDGVVIGKVDGAVGAGG